MITALTWQQHAFSSHTLFTSTVTYLFFHCSLHRKPRRVDHLKPFLSRPFKELMWSSGHCAFSVYFGNWPSSFWDDSATRMCLNMRFQAPSSMGACLVELPVVEEHADRPGSGRLLLQVCLVCQSRYLDLKEWAIMFISLISSFKNHFDTIWKGGHHTIGWPRLWSILRWRL